MKILFLVNKQTYHTKMSRVRFHGIRALEKIATVKYWGLNWENYNPNLTVQQNLVIVRLLLLLLTGLCAFTDTHGTACYKVI